MPKYLVTKCLTWDELSPEQRAKLIDKNRDIRLEILSNEEIIWEFSEAGNKIADAGFLNPDVYYVYNHCQGQGACFDCELFNWELLLEDLDIPHKQLFIKLIENSPAVAYGIRRPKASYAYHYMHEKCRVFFLNWDTIFEDDRKFKRGNKILKNIRWHIEAKRLAVSQEAFSEICKAIDWLQSDECVTEELEYKDYYYNEETLRVEDETKLVDMPMSTRANYIFKSGRKTLATFYIHHDGYPEGAAEYFHKALIFGNGKINSPDTFLRANDACEISDIHGDIAYLYEFDIQTQKLKVFKVYFTETGNEKSLYIVDDVYMFINRYGVVFSSSKLHEYRRKYAWKSDSEIEQIIKNEKTWHYISSKSRYNDTNKTQARCLELVYKELRESTEELINDTIRYSTSNPNYYHLAERHFNLIKQLKVLEDILNDEKESNNG